MKKTLTILSFLFITQLLSAQQWGAFTLYSTQNSTTAYLVDTNGTTHHSWTGMSAGTGYSSYLMPGGTLVRSIRVSGTQLSGGGMTGGVQKVAWDGTLLWNFVYSSATYCLHHDICPLPNGNVLMISYDVKTAMDATNAGSSTAHTMWSEKIMEVQPTGLNTGTVVWEWKLWDHLTQSVNAARANYNASTLNHPELLDINYSSTSTDWVHMNGIDYNPDLDQIVIGSHNLNQVFVIDHSTTTAEAASHSGGNSGKGGDFLYRWGNPASYGATGTRIFNVVHDAHFIPSDCPNAGYIVGYNNNGISATASCVDMAAPPYDGYNYLLNPGSAYAPSTYTKRINCNGHNSNMGNSQQLPNGNSLICIAQGGIIKEVDSVGNLLWSITPGGTQPQAFRYSACYVSGTPPTTPSIIENAGTLDAGTGTSFQWYENGVAIPGATGQQLIPQN
ncbi:MAG: aryl-sulfate sulfotransferase, partial [Bacteroidota bacterium]